MNVKRQSVIYLRNLRDRKREPAKPRTLMAYRSYIANWILPAMGALDLSEVKNAALKDLVARMAAAGKSPATIAGVTNCVKSILQSAVNAEGDYLYPMQWNNDFIDAPPVNSRDQKSPVVDSQGVATALSAMTGQYRPLIALLAGTGCRISEALAIRKGPGTASTDWDPEKAIVSVRTQSYHGLEGTPKSAAGFREIDLAPALNDYLKECFGEVSPGDPLFVNQKNKPLSIDTANARRVSAGIPGFHSFRRFRTTHLRASWVPEDIIQFWIGHAGKNITDRYSKMAQNVEARKKYATEVGLGFEIPKEGQ